MGSKIELAYTQVEHPAERCIYPVTADALDTLHTLHDRFGDRVVGDAVTLFSLYQTEKTRKRRRFLYRLNQEDALLRLPGIDMGELTHHVGLEQRLGKRVSCMDPRVHRDHRVTQALRLYGQTVERIDDGWQVILRKEGDQINPSEVRLRLVYEEEGLKVRSETLHRALR